MVAATSARIPPSALRFFALFPIAGFGLLAWIAGYAFSNGIPWADGVSSAPWIIGAGLWAALGAAFLTLLLAPRLVAVVRSRVPAAPILLAALATGNLLLGAVGIVLANLAGYGRFPHDVVDTLLFVFLTNGLLVCALAWIGGGMADARGWKVWLARGLASANGGIAIVFAAVLAWGVLHPAVR